MWTRREIKSEAKEFLRKNYLKAFVVCLIFSLLVGGGNNGSNTSVENQTEAQIELQEAYEDMLPDGFVGDSIDNAVAGTVPKVLGVSALPTWVMGLTAAALLVGFFISLFFTNVLEVGVSKFFLDGFEGKVKVGNMFSIFGQRNYMNMVITQLKRQVFIFLWTLLLIVPGIIKFFQYIMIPYILADEPDLTSAEVFARSKALTDGNKFDIFVLGLSFIGWYILGALAFGIGIIFVRPYVSATYAKLYVRLKEEKGFARPEILEAEEIL